MKKYARESGVAAGKTRVKSVVINCGSTRFPAGARNVREAGTDHYQLSAAGELLSDRSRV